MNCLPNLSKWTLEEGYDWIVTSSWANRSMGLGRNLTYAISPLLRFFIAQSTGNNIYRRYFVFETLDEQGMFFSVVYVKKKKNSNFQSKQECRQFRFIRTPKESFW